MKQVLLFVILLLTISCGDKIRVKGHRTEVSREISGYDRIHVSHGMRANIDYGEKDGVTVKTFTSVHEYVKTYVQERTLYVEMEKGKRFTDDPNVVVTISARAIKELNLSGGVRAKSGGVSIFDKEGVLFNFSGGSSFEGALESGRFDAELSGGSSVQLKGNCLVLNMLCSGGSNFNCMEFQTDEFSTELSGGSRCEITVNEKINKASLSGGSRLYYKGTRIVHNVNVSGGSELINRN